MDYENMTVEQLANWIFNTSRYRVNYQDVKSRIENLCMKYARGEFEINGQTVDQMKQDWDTTPIDEIESKGKSISDYEVDEYDDMENAGFVEIYSYNGKEYSIVTWHPGSERHHIGKEIINITDSNPVKDYISKQKKKNES